MANKTKVELEEELESMKISIKKSLLEKDEQTEKIEKLRNQLKQANIENKKLKSEIQFLKEENERIIKESIVDERAMKREMEKIEVEYDNSLKMMKEKLEEKYQILINEHKKTVKNERNAGRKTIINEVLIEKIKEMSNGGKTQKLISESLNVSVGTVNKVLKRIE